MKYAETEDHAQSLAVAHASYITNTGVSHASCTCLDDRDLAFVRLALIVVVCTACIPLVACISSASSRDSRWVSCCVGLATATYALTVAATGVLWSARECVVDPPTPWWAKAIVEGLTFVRDETRALLHGATVAVARAFARVDQVAGVAVSLAWCLAGVVAVTVACVGYQVVQRFTVSRVPEAPRGVPEAVLGAPEAPRDDTEAPRVDPEKAAVLREKFSKLTIKKLIEELAAQGCTHDAEGREYRVNTAHSRKGTLVEAMVGLEP